MADNQYIKDEDFQGKGNGNLSPSSDNDSIVNKGEDKGGGENEKMPAHSKSTKVKTLKQASRCSSRRRSSRTFLAWAVGERLEAMDFLKKWYPAKIVSVDQDESMVLIHFEGWNQRYDEWVEMSSERLRPLTRHSVRTDGRKKTYCTHKVGEHVLAKWTDCKMYPAKITNIRKDGAYEVLFYDGFKKIVPPVKVQQLPQDFKIKKFDCPSLSKLKKLKQNVKKTTAAAATTTTTITESKVPSESKKQKCPMPSSSGGSKAEEKAKGVSVVEKIPSKPDHPKPLSPAVVMKSEHDKKDQSKSSKKKKDRQALFPKRQKLIVAGSFYAKRDRMNSVTGKLGSKMKNNLSCKEGPPVKTEKEVHLKKELLKLPSTPEVKEAITEEKIQIKVEPKDEFEQTEPKSGVCRETLAEDLKLHVPSTGETLLPPTTTLSPKVAAPVKTKVRTGGPRRKRKRKKNSLSVAGSEPARRLSVTKENRGPSPKKRVRSNEKEKVARKEFVIETDHNPYKCVFENCNKSFRKEHLLEYHIKYYHTEDGRPVAAPPPRKRRKTSSICSTDSDHSVRSRPVSASVGSKRRRNVSVENAAAPDTSSSIVTAGDMGVTIERVDVGGDEKTTPKSQRGSSQDSMADESIETEEEESKDEVIHCTCNCVEEKGLMIQCEVCMCWQHVSCMNIKEETLSKKYICNICRNPPGVRDSTRYIYDQDWLKMGQQPHFSFLLPDANSEWKAELMRACHSLVADMHSINTALHSVKKHIKILKNKDDPELKLWTKNWDTLDERTLVTDADDESIIVDPVSDVITPDIKQLMASINLENELEHGTTISGDAKISQTDRQGMVLASEQIKTDEKDELLIVENGHSESEASELSEKPATDCQNSHDSDAVVDRSGGARMEQKLTLVGIDEKSSSLDLEKLQTDSKSKNDDKPFPKNGVPHKDLHVRMKCDSTLLPGEHSVPLSTPAAMMYLRVEDPVKVSEKNLLDHIVRVQEKISRNLSAIENQVTVLEENDQVRNTNVNVLADVPLLKRSLRSIMFDLGKVRRMASYN